MSRKNVVARQVRTGSDEMSQLLRQYGCGPVKFTGTDNALYELLFARI